MGWPGGRGPHRWPGRSRWRRSAGSRTPPAGGLSTNEGSSRPPHPHPRSGDGRGRRTAPGSCPGSQLRKRRTPAAGPARRWPAGGGGHPVARPARRPPEHERRAVRDPDPPTPAQATGEAGELPPVRARSQPRKRRTPSARLRERVARPVAVAVVTRWERPARRRPEHERRAVHAPDTPTPAQPTGEAAELPPVRARSVSSRSGVRRRPGSARRRWPGRRRWSAGGSRQRPARRPPEHERRAVRDLHTPTPARATATAGELPPVRARTVSPGSGVRRRPGPARRWPGRGGGGHPGVAPRTAAA